MGIAEFRQKQATKLCIECRIGGIPPLRAVAWNRKTDKIISEYQHCKLDAAGSKDYTTCDANDFLKKLDWFVCMEGEEWQTLSTQEVGSAS